MKSVLQTWVMELGLRHQGVLVSAMRGCDLAPKHDPSKLAQRLLRAAILEPHCGRYVKPVSYIVVEPDYGRWAETMDEFLAARDHYPNHYIMHFLHAAEIIGYHGPLAEPVFSHRWKTWYDKFCFALHVNPETSAQLDERLSLDEEAFGRMQKERG